MARPELPMGSRAIRGWALKLCAEINKLDDVLGQYSDYEGDEDGPTFKLWEDGYWAFKRRCAKARAEHAAAISAWKRFEKFNELRRPK